MESPGERYNRSGAAERTEKQIRRQDIIDKFSAIPGSPTLLTFPSSDWLAENAIREKRKEHNLPSAFFIGLEHDPKTFIRGVHNMKSEATVKVIDGVASGSDSLYVFQDFKDIDLNDYDQVDASWIDFTGYLTTLRINKLKELWAITKKYLVITAENGLWRNDINCHLKNSDINKYLMSELGSYGQGSFYGSTCAMHHIIFTK